MGRIRSREVTAFLRQMSMLIESGTSVTSGLRTLGQRTTNPELRKLIGDVSDHVEAGNPLWQGFERHPKYFSVVSVNLVKAGEASGTVPTVLRRLIEHREQREAYRDRHRESYRELLATVADPDSGVGGALQDIQRQPGRQAGCGPTQT
jgi:type IV pilus assembly protein PilC